MIKNNFGENFPKLLNEWDYMKNKGLDPFKLGTSYKEKVWWLCPKGHSYCSLIGSRTRKQSTGCPVCAGQLLVQGINDLKTKYPNIANEWDYIKNDPLKPDMVFSKTMKKVWWICPNGHSYSSRIGSRTRGRGCPICSNKKVLKGYNDLATTNPEMLKKWNYDKNNDISPEEVTGISGKKVWWKCEKGHEWQATIAHIAYGRGCPICNNGTSTSFPEQAIYYYLKSLDESCLNRYKLNGRYEIDIFVPTCNIGIEYDGYRWHSSDKKKKLECIKNKIFKDNNIKIIHIKEQNKAISDIENHTYIKNKNDYFYNDEDYIALAKIIEDLTMFIYNKEIKVDIEKDRQDIYNGYLFAEQENSIISNKKIKDFFDYDKNKNVRPEYISRSSGKIVWWKCEKGHSFKKSVHGMDNSTQCPICSKEQAYNNRFGLKYPELLNEWDYEKNYPLKPDDVQPSSNKKIWWICPFGHSYQSNIGARTGVLKCGCPICGRKLAAESKYRKVQQFSLNGELIATYSSIKEAIQKTGVKHISSVCSGKRKTAGHYIWKYVD